MDEQVNSVVAPVQPEIDYTKSRYFKYVTPYTDQEKTVLIMEHSPYIGKLAADFCAKFNCKVGISVRLTNLPWEDIKRGRKATLRQWHYLAVFTSGGRVAGQIGALHVPIQERTFVEEEYMYKSSLVSKERSRGSRDERTSKKIATLLRTIDKEEEAPTDSKLDYRELHGIAAAYLSINDALRNSSTKVEVTGQVADALAKHFLGVDVTGVEQFRGDIQKAYDKYVEQRKLIKDCKETEKRFKSGARAIAMVRDGMGIANWAANYDASGQPLPKHGEVCYFLYTEVHWDDTRPGGAQGKIVFDVPVKRYDRLEDIPGLAVDIAIIKAGMEGKNTAKKNDPLFLPVTDEYYPDLDIATGYQHYTGMWVLIPTTPYEA